MRVITLSLSAAVAMSTITVTSSCSKDKKQDTKKKADTDQDKPKDQDEGNTKTAFPTLDILPEGSILRSVRLPRYDENFIPLSLFVADKLTVIDGHQIEADGVTIELYGKDGNVNAPTSIKMRRAIYTQKHGSMKQSTLKATEAIHIKGPLIDPTDPTSGPSFEASGTGIMYDVDSGRGFLLGPASTVFQIKESDSSTKPKPDKSASPTK